MRSLNHRNGNFPAPNQGDLAGRSNVHRAIAVDIAPGFAGVEESGLHGRSDFFRRQHRALLKFKLSQVCH